MEKQNCKLFHVINELRNSSRAAFKIARNALRALHVASLTAFYAFVTVGGENGVSKCCKPAKKRRRKKGNSLKWARGRTMGNVSVPGGSGFEHEARTNGSPNLFPFPSN